MSHETDATVRPVQRQATAQLVIDVQQGLFRKSIPIHRAEPLLNTITSLIERAHAASVLVVYYIQHASDRCCCSAHRAGSSVPCSIPAKAI